MPIIKDLSPAYPAPVTYTYAGEDGKLKTFEFDAFFARLKQSVIDDFVKKPPAERAQDREILSKYMTGWSIADTPFSQTALDEFCEDAVGMRSAIAMAWWDSIQKPQAAHSAAKNSKP